MLDLFSLSQVRERERDHNSLKFYIKNAEFAGACYSMSHLNQEVLCSDFASAIRKNCCRYSSPCLRLKGAYKMRSYQLY